MNLLIIDDDHISNCTISRSAEKSGLFTRVEVLQNGRAALDFLALTGQNPDLVPDVIFISLDLAGMLPFELVANLVDTTSRCGKRVHIAALGPSTSSHTHRLAAEVGVDEHLRKPVSSRAVHALACSLRKANKNSCITKAYVKVAVPESLFSQANRHN